MATALRTTEPQSASAPAPRPQKGRRKVNAARLNLRRVPRRALTYREAEAVCVHLSSLTEGLYGLGGRSKEGRTFVARHLDQALDWDGGLREFLRPVVADDPHAPIDVYLQKRYAPRFNTLTLRSAQGGWFTLAHDVRLDRWHIATGRCPRCAMPVVDRSADRQRGDYCSVTCREGTLTDHDHSLVLAILNGDTEDHDGVRGVRRWPLERDALIAEMRGYCKGVEAEAVAAADRYIGNFEPGNEDVRLEIATALAKVDGINWSRTFELWRTLPATIDVIALIDGTTVLQDGFAPYRHVTDYRPFAKAAIERAAQLATEAR